MFDHQIETSGTWKSIILEGKTPEDTSLQFRYKTAGTEELLDEAPWSEYYDERILNLPRGLQKPWIRIEVLFQGTPSATPGMNSLEVIYEHPLLLRKGLQWSLY